MTVVSSVVVGGGMAGMLSAWLLAKRGERVTLIEREAEIGGLLRSFDYGEWGRFDYGAHNIGQIGVAEVDEFFYSLLPPDEWQVLKGNKRDLAGTYFCGRLGAGSVYADLRSLPLELYEKTASELLSTAQSGAPISESDAGSYLSSRFGNTIGNHVLGRVVTKLFGRPPAELDVFATMLTSLDRVVMFDEAKTLQLYGSPALRERLGYPDQRNLPGHLSSGRIALYPKRYGMHRVIDSFRDKLKEAGVAIRCNAALTVVNTRNGRVSDVLLSCDRVIERLEFDGSFVWTIGLIPLTVFLGRPAPGAGDRPPQTVIINFLLDRPLTTDLYYFYCYDEGYQTFRVTNFSEFCDGAKRAGGYPVCMEVLLDPSAPADVDKIIERAKVELMTFGVTEKATRFLFSRVEFLAGGFPMPSLANVAVAEGARSWLAGQSLSNLTTVGILAKPRLFFQKDILKDVFATVGGLTR